jgi:antitoxin VapB
MEAPMGDLAKVIRDGSGQAVRLPDEFRVEGDTLRIRWEGRKIVLEPVEEDMSWVDRLEPLDDDAAAAALERPGPDSYERPDIDLG